MTDSIFHLSNRKSLKNIDTNFDPKIAVAAKCLENHPRPMVFFYTKCSLQKVENSLQIENLSINQSMMRLKLIATTFTHAYASTAYSWIKEVLEH